MAFSFLSRSFRESFFTLRERDEKKRKRKEKKDVRRADSSRRATYRFAETFALLSLLLLFSMMGLFFAVPACTTFVISVSAQVTSATIASSLARE